MENRMYELLERFPFLSLCKVGNEEYIGIVQNCDVMVASVYVYNSLNCIEHKELFLTLGDEWWWDSNRQMPINLIIGERFRALSYSLCTFNSKNFTILSGPSVSLSNIITKRIKRRQIQLVRKM
jgi:hypothetical protein